MNNKTVESIINYAFKDLEECKGEVMKYIDELEKNDTDLNFYKNRINKLNEQVNTQSKEIKKYQSTIEMYMRIREKDKEVINVLEYQINTLIR